MVLNETLRPREPYRLCDDLAREMRCRERYGGAPQQMSGGVDLGGRRQQRSPAHGARFGKVEGGCGSEAAYALWLSPLRLEKVQDG